MIRPLICAAAIVAAIVASSACASVPAPRSGDEEPARDRDMISEQEIRELPVTTAWELVSRLRPHWLRSRGPASVRGGGPEYPVVYVDEIRSGNIEFLHQISTMVVAEIRFISGRDATTRMGLNHGAGAIMVTTHRGP